MDPEKNQCQFVQLLPKALSLKDFNAGWCWCPEDQERTPLSREIPEVWRVEISQLRMCLPKYLHPHPSHRHPYFSMRDQVEWSISRMLQLCRTSHHALVPRIQPYLPCNLQERKDSFKVAMEASWFSMRVLSWTFIAFTPPFPCIHHWGEKSADATIFIMVIDHIW